MATSRDPRFWFRALCGIAVWIVIIGVVGLVTTGPALVRPHGAATVQAFLFAAAAVIAGVSLYIWSARKARSRPRR